MSPRRRSAARACITARQTQNTACSIGPAVRALHAELGDANLYVRGVLHQLHVQDRIPAVHHLATLLGERGQAFLVELSPAANHLFASMAQRFGAPPAKLQDILSHGIAPATLQAGTSPRCFITRASSLAPREPRRS